MIAESQPLRDDASFEELEGLFRTHGERIQALCRRLLGSDDSAQDAVQETFLRLARLEHRVLETVDDLDAYVATVARRVCFDELRRRRRLVSGRPEEVSTPDAGPSPESTAIDRCVVESAWRQLDDTERLLVAHSFSGYSHAETAERMGRNLKAVSVALCRARHHARVLAGALTVLGGVASWLRRTQRRVSARMVSLRLDSAEFGLSAAQPLGLVVAGALAAGTVGAPLMGAMASRAPAPAAVARAEATPTTISALASVAAAADAPSVAPAPVTRQPSGVAVAVPAAPAGAVSTSAPDPTVVVGSVVSPGSGASEKDSSMNLLTPSPRYATDHTVYASGYLASGCGRPQCPMLWRTTNGGATWKRLGGDTFLGGRVLLPASYPADPTLYAASPEGLERSDDGGATFRVVAPPGPAAISPVDASGVSVVIGGASVVIYNETSGAVSPGPVLPPQVTRVTDVAYSGDGSAVLVAAQQPDASAPSGWDGVLLRCIGATQCAPAVSIADQTPLTFAVVRQGAEPLVAFGPDVLAASRDGGASYTTTPLGNGEAVTAAAAGAGSLAVAVRSTNGSTPRLLLSTDGGRSFVTMAPSVSVPMSSIADIAPLGRGRILASVAGDAGGIFGIRCSIDSGRSWVLAC